MYFKFIPGLGAIVLREIMIRSCLGVFRHLELIVNSSVYENIQGSDARPPV